MRYEDWDILLFARDCKVPFKEFKVACHVVHDSEFALTHGSVGIPTVCCFVPSMAPGSPYKLSIHSWSTPPISQFTRTYSKYLDDMTFEARLFVDGCLVSSTSFERAGPWPTVMKHSFGTSMNMIVKLAFANITADILPSGEHEPLKFPTFQRELLQQNYWSPADEFGRIKVVISETFPRDATSVTKERVKNVVAFAFQHAPLDVLESSSIAWPNPSMWRTMPFTSSLNLPSQTLEDLESHAHSPRDGYSSLKPPKSAELNENSLRERTYPPKSSQRQKRMLLTAPEKTSPSASIDNKTDPFTDANAYFEWLSGIGMGLGAESPTGQAMQVSFRNGRKSSTDVSMPDYTPADQVMQLSSSVFDPKQDDEASTVSLKVPTNTPITAGDKERVEPECITFPNLPHNSSLPIELANSFTNSFLNQPVPVPFRSEVPIASMSARPQKESRESPEECLMNSREKLVTNTKDADEISETSKLAHLPLEATALATAATRDEDEPPSSKALSKSQRENEHCSVSVDAPERRGKRFRNFTPTSSKVFEEDEEPRRASPRIRLNPSSEQQKGAA